MQFLWFFLSVFCGILGAYFALRLLYRMTVDKLTQFDPKRDKKLKLHRTKTD